MRRNMISGILAGVAAAVTPVAASAQDAVASFYKGKTINMVVGTSAGGGYDLYARFVARYMAKYIPGSPSIVISNMPGAGSLVATQYVANVAPKDGTVIGAVFFGVLMEPLLGDAAKAKFDALKLNWIGSANKEAPICIARTDSPVQKMEDIFTKELVVGASATSGSTRDFPALLRNVLGAKFKIVGGYPGSNEISLAIEKGEVEAACGYGWTSLIAGRPQWLKDKFVNILAQETLTPNPTMKQMGIPLAIDFAKTQEQRQIMELIYAPLEWGRPYIAAPEVPADRIEALQKAFMQAVESPELLEEAKKQNIEIEPAYSPEIKQLLERLYKAPPNIVEKAKKAILVD